MQQQIMNDINRLASDYMLDYASPNGSIVAEVLQLDAETLDQVTPDRLSKYIFVLGQYLVTLKHLENKKNIDCMLATRFFENKMQQAIFIADEVPGKSEKARRSWIVHNVPEVAELETTMLVKQAEKMLLEGSSSSIEALQNALKKELSSREGERFGG